MLKGKTLLTPWQRQQSPSCSTYFSDSFLCGGSAPLPGFWGTPPQWKWSKSTAPFFPAQAKIKLSEISSILNLTHQWLCKLSFISLRKGGVNGKNKTVCWKRGMWMNGHCFQTCILIECLFVDIYETYAIQNWYWIFYMKFETWRNLLEENIRFNTLD